MCRGATSPDGATSPPGLEASSPGGDTGSPAVPGGLVPPPAASGPTTDHEGDASNFDSARVDGMGSDGPRHRANSSYHPSGFPGCTPSTGYTPVHPETVPTGFLVPTGVTVVSIDFGVEGLDIGGPDDLVWTVP